MNVKAVEHDNRGDVEHPYGFVYFDDGRRVVYAKGLGEFEGVSSGTGGWQAVTNVHITEAQRYLKEVYRPDWNKAKAES